MPMSAKPKHKTGAPEAAVKKFWKFFIAAEYEKAGALFERGAKIYWPCTNEVFDDFENFIKVNRDYPGAHKIILDKIVSAGDTVISVVLVESIFDGSPAPMFFRAVSFFKLTEGLISELSEYWAEVTAPPEWRVKSRLTRIERPA